ncbi:MAG: hypothetical protein SFY66_07610 [Oculatellaceae cyanobacterium bins.114]|nr:hypothetical protein [Oculatellaceae cyanobacterium bins.114]
MEQALALAQNLEMEENVKQLQIIIDRFEIAVQTMELMIRQSA